MSDLIFPTLKGLTYPIGKVPHWNTLQNQTISGVKKFLQLYSYPYYEIKLSFSYLGDDNDRTDDIHTLMGFFNQLGGAGQDFLFADPFFEPNGVDNLPFGEGDSTSTSFRLLRRFGDTNEPVFGIAEAPTIYRKAGSETVVVPDSDYTWNTNGLITFNSPPATGTILSWSGNWFYRCHFQADEAEFQQIFQGGWELEELILETIKLE